MEDNGGGYEQEYADENDGGIGGPQQYYPDYQ